MGKLRTANNRRNRAIRQTVARTHAAAIAGGLTTKVINPVAKPTKAAS
jgi:hypothetical protein